MQQIPGDESTSPLTKILLGIISSVCLHLPCGLGISGSARRLCRMRLNGDYRRDSATIDTCRLCKPSPDMVSEGCHWKAYLKSRLVPPSVVHNSMGLPPRKRAREEPMLHRRTHCLQTKPSSLIYTTLNIQQTWRQLNCRCPMVAAV